MEIIDRIKYGKVIENIDLGGFHVVRPEDNPLIKLYLMGRDGQLYNCYLKNKEAYFQSLRKIGQEHLDGTSNFNADEAFPLNSTCFVLPIKPNILNNLIHKVNGLEGVNFSGKIKHSMYDLIPNGFVLETEQNEQTQLEKAKQYIESLLFWKLHSRDCFDKVGINVQERAKAEKTSGFYHGLRRNFIVDRKWSKTDKGLGGKCEVAEEDGERIVISGYQPN